VSWKMGLVDPFGVRTVFVWAFLPWVNTHGYYWAVPTGLRRLLKIRDRI
jgi:hypothetical protein